ncbi:MAG TPA: hypothetical protein VN519_10745 [Bryobacteraceae bacterium]|nr:hypothetical protein [Bryobacteraceae bacterium]
MRGINIGGCRELARLCMAGEAAGVPGFCAAYTAGSTNWMPDDAALLPGSDVDVMVVVAGGDLAGTRRKFMRDGVLFEVSYLSQDLFEPPERVLSDYHLAPSLQTAKVVVDPEGRLDRARDVLRRGYEDPRWIRARCEMARAKVLAVLGSESETGCLFAAGITAHILLVAGRRNPTVRGRYGAVRALLADHGFGEFHETLLELLGSRRVSAGRAATHAVALGEAFDAACGSMPGSFGFAADIQECTRPAAIDASMEMIARGEHREAMFWIGVTWTRCMTVPATDRFQEGFREVLRDLGLSSGAAIGQRRREIERALPRVCGVAEQIIESTARTPSPSQAPHCR